MVLGGARWMHAKSGQNELELENFYSTKYVSAHIVQAVSHDN